MKSLFKDILSENEFARPLAYVPREQSVTLLPKKATTVIGVRRSGKTTFLRQIWDGLVASGKVTPEQLIHVNFVDERLYGLPAARLGELLEAYYETHPEADPEKPLYFFLDELQEIKGWEYFINRLLRAGHRVFLSGSSARLLSREIASVLRGRSLSVEMFPFSFREVLTAEKKTLSPRGPRERALLRMRFKTFLKEGGFPETIDVSTTMRRRLLQDYLDAVLLRDVIERYNPSDPVALIHLSHLLMNQVGGYFTINKTCERLKAQGLKVNKPEISAAIDWLEDSYLFFSVPLFSQSVQKRLVNPRKLYCVDTGMAFHQASALADNWGHLLENAVYLHLRRQTSEIFYFRDVRQREVDFVWVAANRKPHLVQVSWSLQDPVTRKRELDALASAMSALSVKESILVTYDEEEDLKLSGKTVHVRPAWAYLLKSELT